MRRARGSTTAGRPQPRHDPRLTHKMERADHEDRPLPSLSLSRPLAFARSAGVLPDSTPLVALRTPGADAGVAMAPAVRTPVPVDGTHTVAAVPRIIAAVAVAPAPVVAVTTIAAPPVVGSPAIPVERTAAACLHASQFLPAVIGLTGTPAVLANGFVQFVFCLVNFLPAVVAAIGLSRVRAQAQHQPGRCPQDRESRSHRSLHGICRDGPDDLGQARAGLSRRWRASRPTSAMWGGNLRLPQRSVTFPVRRRATGAASSGDRPNVVVAATASAGRRYAAG
jgi:hypothetical protein